MVAVLAVIVVVAFPFIPLDRVFVNDEDRLEDRLARLENRLEYGLETGKPAEAYSVVDRAEDGDVAGIARQPEQETGSGDASRADSVLTVANPNQCFEDPAGANTGNARNAPDGTRCVPGSGVASTGLELAGATAAECDQRVKQAAAAG